MSWTPLSQLTLAWIAAIALTGKAASSSSSAAADFGAYNLTESEYLALEGGSILPFPESVSKVERHLSLIRKKYPEINEIKHNRKWIPGQVLTTKISQEQINRVNSSQYGPLRHVERIDVMPFFSITVLSFDKPYSPPVLAKLLEEEFQFPCSPNTVYYEYEVDNIGYRMANTTYIFKKGTGVCKENCSDRYLWEFQADDNDAKLMKQWVVPQNGERVVIY